MSVYTWGLTASTLQDTVLAHERNTSTAQLTTAIERAAGTFNRRFRRYVNQGDPSDITDADDIANARNIIEAGALGFYYLWTTGRREQFQRYDQDFRRALKEEVKENAAGWNSYATEVQSVRTHLDDLADDGVNTDAIFDRITDDPRDADSFDFF